MGHAGMDELRGEGWTRLLAAARRKLERGGDTGSIGLNDPSEAERRVIIGLTGKYRPESVKRLAVPLPQLDAALTARYGMGLRETLTRLSGPLQNRPAERTALNLERDHLLATAKSSSLTAEPWFTAWLDSLTSDGTLTRLIRRGDAHLLNWATSILDLLPNLDERPTSRTAENPPASRTTEAPTSPTATPGQTIPSTASQTATSNPPPGETIRSTGARTEGAPASSTVAPGQAVPLPVLSERATGDTKALAPGSPLALLVLRALASRAGLPTVPGSRAGQRELWESAGVIVDDLASQVLVLNLQTRSAGVVSGWLDEAARHGLPFRLTLQQQAVSPVIPAAAEIFVCENPAVLRTAAAELGSRAATLICTEGVPSMACHRLLDAAVAAGARLRWRADFDWTGLRIVGRAISRYGATPWRMSATDYTTALTQGESTPLTGPPAPDPWDRELATLMTSHGRAVMEERLIPFLLTDLKLPPV
ncbi:hypothetical protein GCM10009555_039270 [Acrocarpospora macrocephala]|uniref:TIGR02679 family protein n=2 Tax=Acrocarpospora macrocephala TaxID=150177 RepID=A0A5M3WT68_9ACTN|nr:hypothetical protein Amac_034090 [Acrocarpospora macrocephala]